MFEQALPIWLARGFEKESGAFLEALNFDGSNANIAFRRTRVSCRQIYVYSHASLMGWKDGLPAAEAAARWLTAHAWRADGKGFVRRLTPEYSAQDSTIDLYDNAFAVFAFAWLHRATGSAWSLEWALKTLRAIKTHWTHSSGLGFWHDETRALPRQQNPHMHLIEACLVGYNASGNSEFLDTATHIAALFSKHFFDGKTLAEYFDDNWQRMPNDSGRHIEPGHMLEWAWILGEYGRATNTDQRVIIAGLIDWAEKHGVDHTSGITYNVVRDDGTPIDRGSRTWPNTERLKAAVVAHNVLKRDPAQTRAIAAQCVDVLLNRYLATDGTNKVPGGWVDHFKADGSVNAANMPASTFYHVFLAFAEALNAEGLIE